MKKTLLLTLLSFVCTSASVLAKVQQPMATCPTVAVINSVNPSNPPSIPPWGLQYIRGTSPYNFVGAEIKFKKVGNTEEAQVTCKYRDSSKALNMTITQFSPPVVEPRTCSFIINEHAIACPYGDPAKCTVYCSS